MVLTRGCQTLFLHHVSLFTYPLVLYVISIILVSITFSLRPNEAMFVMAKVCLPLSKYSVLCSVHGVYIIISDTYDNLEEGKSGNKGEEEPGLLRN